MVEHLLVSIRIVGTHVATLRVAAMGERFMHLDHATLERTTPSGSALRVYMLGVVDFEAALTLQRTLAFEAAGARDSAALVLCEHPPIITVGRDGSPADIRCDLEELRAATLAVAMGQSRRRHALAPARPNGHLSHPAPGLARSGPGRLPRTLAAHPGGCARRFQRAGRHPLGTARSLGGGRLLAGVGVAVCDWVAYYGAYLNVNPDLFPFRIVRTGAKEHEPMTSLVRERRGPVRPALVRQRLLEHFLAAFPFERTALFSHHPCLGRRPIGAGHLAAT